MKRKDIAGFMALVMVTALGVSAWAADSRYALVIGNAAYKNIEKLENTINDAQDIAAALRNLGFEVDLRLDVTEAQFSSALDAHIGKLASDRNSEGFFWYAGHGVQIPENYLLPVDVSIESERSLRQSAYSLDGLLADLGAVHNRVNVVILDACRNNPLPSSSRGAGTRGLAAIQDVPGDLFVMFSTAAGEAADDGRGKRNSPFAEAFLKYIDSTEPVVMMASDVTQETLRLTNNKQRPFSRGSIISDKYYSLNPNSSPPVSQTEPFSNPVPTPIPAPAPFPSPAPRPQPKTPGTAGAKFGIGALNLFMGLGSYLDGDTAGGITLTAGYGAAAGLLVIEALALDWDDPLVGVPATIGVAAAGLTIVYGFVRPFIHQRSSRGVSIMDAVRVGLVPTADSALGITLAFTLSGKSGR